MNKIRRNSFIKMSALALLAPWGNAIAGAGSFDKAHLPENDILERLIAANDKQVTALLESINGTQQTFSRRIGQDFSTLAASYCYPSSAYYHDLRLVARMEILTDVLHKFQTADGTVNVGNLESPPDTAFVVELLSGGAYILSKDNSAELKNVKDAIKAFLLNAGNALVTGGVHTPNHRWVISAALAQLNALYPDKKYVKRIDEWLSEGVFQDADGHYPERSPLYAGVENTAYITIARLMNRPSMFAPVRKNLHMMYYYMEPNGDLVTTDSRRQDQYQKIRINANYLHYRYLAIKDNNAQFAAIARFIENSPDFEKEVLNKALFHFLEEPLLQRSLPAETALPLSYEKLFTTTQLLRIRRGDTSSTLFGGVDWPLTIASGRSNSPDFYSFRKRNAVLKSLRLSTAFFGMGYFYSEGIKKEGSKYVLHKKLAIPYYQPLPDNFKNSKGDYKLSPSTDGRFWNKMDFSKRPVSNVKTLNTTVTFLENANSNELHFNIDGMAGVAVTIELCFLEDGKLSGVTNLNSDDSFLESGFGEYECGGDRITFGPGANSHKKITALEGERYSTHFGTLRTAGKHVYITGVTPFKHKLMFS